MWLLNKKGKEDKKRLGTGYKSTILSRIKDYFESEPYSEDGVWSWSESSRVDLVFPELLFQNKATKQKVQVGVAFQVLDIDNLDEVERYRKIFMDSNIPCVLISNKEIPSSVDLKTKLEAVFQNQMALLSIKQ